MYDANRLGITVHDQHVNTYTLKVRAKTEIEAIVQDKTPLLA